MHTPTSPSERVALVVVHGIADQRPGQTVREVARLLCRGGPGAPPYEQGEVHEVLVPVARLEPASEARERDGTRRQPGTPSGFYQQQAAQPDAQDLGKALNDYLLGRLALPEGDALYESTRVSLRRRADGRALDLYEMYWADLSRLGGGGLRALSSLYQLFFHLNTLAADVVDQVSLSARGGAAWRLLQRLHAWMAWLMKGPTALLQLAMLLLAGFGAAALVHRDLQPQLLAAAFGLGSIALAALAAAATAAVALNAPHWVARLYFASCALGIVLLGAYLVERYSRVAEGVRLPGHLVVLGTAVAVWLVGQAVRPRATTQVEWMLVAAIKVGEALLVGVLLAWAAFVAVQIATLLLGLWLGRGCDRAGRASLHTSRLLLVGSSGLFALLTLVLWSVVSYVAGRALSDFLYLPVLFPGTYRSVDIFFDDRVQSLGAFFTPLVVAFALVIGAALMVVLPSLLEELSPTRNLDAAGARKGAAEWARRLGTWLGAGVRALGTAFKALVPLAALAGGLLYLAFVARQIAFTTGTGRELTAWLAGVLEIFQGESLVAAGKWLAAGALTLAALGARFTETFGRLRVAIDAVLDVDNYFADPPDRRPPRARASLRAMPRSSAACAARATRASSSWRTAREP